MKEVYLPLYNLPGLFEGLHCVTGCSHCQLVFYVNGTYLTNFSFFKNYKQTDDKTLFTGVSHLVNFSFTPTPFYENALHQMPHSRFSTADSPL